MQLLLTLAGLALGTGIALAVPINAAAQDTPRADRDPAGVVQLTPVGGPTTPEGGATDVALLIGVSAAAVAGGIGLFAAAGHAARRLG